MAWNATALKALRCRHSWLTQHPSAFMRCLYVTLDTCDVAELVLRTIQMIHRTLSSLSRRKPGSTSGVGNRLSPVKRY
jgi:hypothetical protein